MIRAGFQAEEGATYDASTLDTGYNVVLRKHCMVGARVRIWSNTIIDEHAIIYPDACVHCNCYISQGCVVGQGAFIGPGTQLLNDRYPVRRSSGLWEPVHIGDKAVIGGGVTVCPGVIIGEGAMIGAGSVVTKDVPAYQAWVGVPANRLDWDAEQKWLRCRDQQGLLDDEEVMELRGGAMA